jgi:hypothetical protein
MNITRRKSKYPPIPVNNSKEILRKHHTLVETLRSETSIQSLRFINSCIYGHCQGNRFDPSRLGKYHITLGKVVKSTFI